MTKISVAALVGLAAAGCVPASASEWLLAPADPRRGGRDARYSDVMRGVKRFGVVEPKDWRALNRAVGPQGGSSMPGMDMGSKRNTGGR